MLSQKQILLLGTALSGVSVLLGAFGAHALKPLLSENGRVDTFELAVRYQFFHSLGMICVGLLVYKVKTKLLIWSALLFTGGIVLFSGSLYCYALTNISAFAMITPLGGVLFLGGWFCLFLTILKSNSQEIS
jgi:Uncharacterized small membrane protein